MMSSYLRPNSRSFELICNKVLIKQCYNFKMIRQELYYASFVATEIVAGDVIPIDKSGDWKIEFNLSGIKPTFSESVVKNKAYCQKTGLTQQLAEKAVDIDPNLIELLQAFTFSFSRLLDEQSTAGFNRKSWYEDKKEKGITPKLTDIFGEKMAMCSEVSLFAYHFLKENGIDVKFFNGAMLREIEELSIPELHAFLVINSGGQELIFDPANPSVFSDGKRNLPLLTLLKPCVKISDQLDVMRQNVLMLECENIASGDKSFYGVSDGTNIDLSDIVRFPQDKWRTAVADDNSTARGGRG